MQYSDDEVIALMSPDDVPPVENMLFCIVSKGRPHAVSDMAKLFDGTGVEPTWLVGDEAEVKQYAAAGASHVAVGGLLCATRNAALDRAKAAGCAWCVQLSDDIQQLEFLKARKGSEDGAWRDAAPGQPAWRFKPPAGGLSAANAEADKCARLRVSAVGAGFCAALFRAAMSEWDWVGAERTWVRTGKPPPPCPTTPFENGA